MSEWQVGDPNNSLSRVRERCAVAGEAGARALEYLERSFALRQTPPKERTVEIVAEAQSKRDWGFALLLNWEHRDDPLWFKRFEPQRDAREVANVSR